MKELKEKVLVVRIDLSTKELLKKKCKDAGFNNLSQFILQAAINYNQTNGPMRIELLDRWYSKYSEVRNSLVNIGTNLNQLAKYENTLAANGVYNPALLAENSQLKQECKELLEKINSFNKMILKEIDKV